MHGRRDWEREGEVGRRKKLRNRQKRYGETERKGIREELIRQDREGKVEEREKPRRTGSNGNTGRVRLKVERRDGVRVLSPSSLLLSHPFLWVVLLWCLAEKWQRQICSLQPLLATNEFRLHPNELLTEPLLHSYQSKTCKARSLEFIYGPKAKQKKYCLI